MSRQIVIGTPLAGVFHLPHQHKQYREMLLNSAEQRMYQSPFFRLFPGGLPFSPWYFASLGFFYATQIFLCTPRCFFSLEILLKIKILVNKSSLSPKSPKIAGRIYFQHVLTYWFVTGGVMLWIAAETPPGQRSWTTNWLRSHLTTYTSRGWNWPV